MREILKVLEQDARASLRAIADFVAQKLSTIDRVTSTSTHFLLKKYKDDGDIFADREVDHRLMVAP